MANYLACKRSLALFILAGALLAIPSSQALEIGEKEIYLQLDFTYASQYMWKGFDTFGGNGSFQPSLEIGDDHWFAGVWHAEPDSSGFETLSETDLYLGYTHSFFAEERYGIDATLMYTYFAFPATGSAGDVQEINMGVAWPNLISFWDTSLIPRYDAYYEFSGVQSSEAIDNGWYQTPGLDWEIPVDLIDHEEVETYCTLSSEITYNDGVFGTDPGFSHATFGASIEFAWRNYYLAPAIYFQKSFEDTVNDEDELYGGVSVGVVF